MDGKIVIILLFILLSIGASWKQATIKTYE